uniref:TctD transcriptional regulator n=1 Tax=Callithamnion tetricum TaxID=193179 RepID=A0A4D6WQF3_9FLOR|nr:hypothetical protein [Callithamnion tetricum]
MYRILLVEDDISVSSVLSDYLVLQGFRVYIANNVQLALYGIFLFKPNLIITDIIMSHLSGYDFIKIIRLDYRFMTIPFLFLTAKGMTNDRIIGYNLGCNIYLSKPFHPKELISIIKNSIQTFIDLDVDFYVNITEYNSIDYLSLYFTDREEAILNLVLKGYTNKEIAIQLNLSVRNIEKYISRLLNKTRTRNRTELVKVILGLDYKFNSIFI